jgi:hypothetical protein
MNDLPSLIISKKTGGEQFHVDGQPLLTTVLAFWQWAASDLSSNATRGRLAEFLVAHALGCADGVRIEWDAYDVCTGSGVKIEVKSAAYLQSWAQRRPSTIIFDIRPTLSLNTDTNSCDSERKRQANVYVFALLAHRDKATLDPLNVAQWQFYVLATKILNERAPVQRTIGLPTLQRFGAQHVTFDALAETIKRTAVL